MRYTILLLAALLALAACQKEFDRPAPETLILGQKTRQEIMAEYGQPYSQRTTVVGAPIARTAGPTSGATGMGAAGTFITMNYIYTDPMSKFLGGLPRQKQIVFEFFNDRLYAYNFISDVDDDNSNFDEAKVAELENGRTTREQATALLGPPTGRAVFPAVPAAGEKLVYQYVTGTTSTRESKRLELLFDNGTLRDFNFVSRSGIPAPVQRGATAVPIIIPTR